MTGTYLLDTNALIALFARDLSIEKLAAEAVDVFLPVTAVGELFYGAEKSARVDANLKRIEEIVARRKVLVCDTDTARLFGKIKQRLRARGRPIPDHDIWIAAIVMQHGLTLVTRDAHFNEVEGWRWQAGDLPLTPRYSDPTAISASTTPSDCAPSASVTANLWNVTRS